MAVSIAFVDLSDDNSEQVFNHVVEAAVKYGKGGALGLRRFNETGILERIGGKGDDHLLLPGVIEELNGYDVTVINVGSEPEQMASRRMAFLLQRHSLQDRMLVVFPVQSAMEGWVGAVLGPVRKVTGDKETIADSIGEILGEEKVKLVKPVSRKTANNKLGFQ